jgi:hypothetical protein
MAKERHLGPGELTGVKQEDQSAEGEVYRDDGGTTNKSIVSARKRETIPAR